MPLVTWNGWQLNNWLIHGLLLGLPRNDFRSMGSGGRCGPNASRPIVSYFWSRGGKAAPHRGLLAPGY